MNLRRLDMGGSWPDVSTSTGRPCLCALLQWRLAVVVHCVGDVRRLIGDGGLVLPRLGASYPRSGDDLVHADLDEPSARQSDGVVVSVAMLAGMDSWNIPWLSLWSMP